MFARKNSYDAVDNNENNSFTLYADGIGYNGYSMRLSNFTFSNGNRNTALLASWAVGIGTAAANSIGFSSPDDRTHYKIFANERHNYRGFKFFMARFTNAIVDNGACGNHYNQSLQEEFYKMSCKTIYQLPERANEWSTEIGFCRAFVQPAQEEMEKCLTTLVKEIHCAWLVEDTALRKIDAEEAQARLDISNYYFFRGLGIFALGAGAWIAQGMYREYRKNWDYRNNPAPFKSEERLKKINFQGEIDYDFICPISRAIMDDPVTANDGKTYDRKSITDWCKLGTGNSPFYPNLKIDLDKLKPNSEILERIEKFISGLENSGRIKKRV